MVCFRTQFFHLSFFSLFLANFIKDFVRMELPFSFSVWTRGNGLAPASNGFRGMVPGFFGPFFFCCCYRVSAVVTSIEFGAGGAARRPLGHVTRTSANHRSSTESTCFFLFVFFLSKFAFFLFRLPHRTRWLYGFYFFIFFIFFIFAS